MNIRKYEGACLFGKTYVEYIDIKKCMYIELKMQCIWIIQGESFNFQL